MLGKQLVGETTGYNSEWKSVSELNSSPIETSSEILCNEVTKTIYIQFYLNRGQHFFPHYFPFWECQYFWKEPKLASASKLPLALNYSVLELYALTIASLRRGCQHSVRHGGDTLFVTQRKIHFSQRICICYLPAYGRSVWWKTVTEVLKMLPEACGLGRHFFSNYFVLVEFISPVKFSKVVFAVWNFVRSLKFTTKTISVSRCF